METKDQDFTGSVWEGGKGLAARAGNQEARVLPGLEAPSPLLAGGHCPSTLLLGLGFGIPLPTPLLFAWALSWCHLITKQPCEPSPPMALVAHSAPGRSRQNPRGGHPSPPQDPALQAGGGLLARGLPICSWHETYRGGAGALLSFLPLVTGQGGSGPVGWFTSRALGQLQTALPTALLSGWSRCQGYP